MRNNINKSVAAAVRNALDRGDFILADDGLILPREGIRARGTYFHSVNGEDERIDHNLIPDAGILSILNVYFGATAKINAFYLALFSGAVNPPANLTAANFAATMTEITSNTEGYSQVTRPQFVSSPASAGTIGNLSNKAQFSIVCTTSITVNGAAMLSDNTKGGTAGVLPSCSRFASARTLFNGDTFELGYTVTLTG
jgi:hypothetical protein